MTIEAAAYSNVQYNGKNLVNRRDLAKSLEVTFVTEILKYAGLGEIREVFGGGTGEDQFASFLREAQAAEIVRAGGLGLSKIIEKRLIGGDHE